MRSLYLLRQRSEEQELERLGLPLLDQLLVVGQMQLTTQAELPQERRLALARALVSGKFANGCSASTPLAGASTT